MTTLPEMRDLAQRLLNYEAGAGNTSEPVESTTLRVYEKLRQSLGEFAGVCRISVARFSCFDAGQIGSSQP